MAEIQPIPVYPVGEFPDGFRLCVSVGTGDVSFFPEYSFFDVPDADLPELEPDGPPTLVDAVDLFECEVLEWS